MFVDGYQRSCGSSQFSDNFGRFDQYFQATGRVSLFFDNCVFSGKPLIEDLGNSFRDFLAALKYADGAPVTQVDIIAHSMGGMIVRSYLAGKQTSAGVFQPPVNTGIRKAVFLAVPHFGSPIAGSSFVNYFGNDVQTTALFNGSSFSFDLATWNQGTDDLRGIDSLALVGDGGTGQATMSSFDDGVVSLTSGSIGFAVPGRTRVVPYCHSGAAVLSAAFLCPPNTDGIAEAKAATDLNAAIVLSFINDTPDWQTLGQPAEQNPLLSTGGGQVAKAKSTADQLTTIQDATASKSLNVRGNAVAWTEYLPAQVQNLSMNTGVGALQYGFTLPAGYVTALTVKNGPSVARVYPAAAVITPLVAAPGMFVSVYGRSLAAATAQASSLPLPMSLGGVQVMANGAPIGLQYVSATQINAVLPATVQSLSTLTVSSSAGSNTVNLLIQRAAPAIFTQNQAGTGAAAALNGTTFALVTPTAPLKAGDYVSLYVTGLGTVHTVGSLQVADQQPTVTVDGKACPVSFAGRAPGFDGLDQINCQIPSGITATSSAFSDCFRIRR